MPGSVSSRAPVVWLTVLAAFATAVAFWWVQNHLRPVGGAIAFQKALWLADAILLWFVIPLFIIADGRTDLDVRRAFTALLALMLARAVIELWMLYVTHSWSPNYGIAHDLICIVVLAWFLFRIAAATRPLPRKRLWLAHIGVTTAAFVPEIYFAWYMQAYFNTTGAQAVYFVPDDPAHAFALNVTTAAVVCSSTCIFIFLYRWLHAASDRDRSGT